MRGIIVKRNWRTAYYWFKRAGNAEGYKEFIGDFPKRLALALLAVTVGACLALWLWLRA